jgi:hypothetical protein
MGHNHYWYRRAEIDAKDFKRILTDFERLILPLEDIGVCIAGIDGSSVPEINQSTITFNGIRKCGHAPNPDIYIPFPSASASGVGKSDGAIFRSNPLFVELNHRKCNGQCSCEPFVFDRHMSGLRKPKEDGSYFNCCKTAFKPYDLAVQCALLISKHHLGDKIRVSSGGSDLHWNDPRTMCYVHLGYPLREYRIDRDEGLIIDTSS